MSCSIDGIGTADRCRAIHTADGRTIEADIIAVGIGVLPIPRWAAAGLAVDDGIVVDEFGRTSDPCIFAAVMTRHFNPLLGRAIRLEAWQNAQNRGHRRGQGHGGWIERLRGGSLALDRSVQHEHADRRRPHRMG